jgi:hypothetical protein
MSRVDPNSLTVSNFGLQHFIILPGKNTQCICVSLIYIHDCALVFGKPVGETMNKKVGGVLHIQEYERLALHFCMQYDMVSQLSVNGYGWVLYFETRNEDFGSKFKQSMLSVFFGLFTCIDLDIDSPVKGQSAMSASPGYNIFPKYPGVAPKAQTPSPSKSIMVSSSSPSKPSSSKPYKPFKPVLDYRDTGTIAFSQQNKHKHDAL